MNLCLGSAAFGLDYGVTNSSGKVPAQEVKKILEYAEYHGIEYFDTAQCYGNSEYLLGQYLRKSAKVSTKISLPKSTRIVDTALISYLDKSLKLA